MSTEPFNSKVASSERTTYWKESWGHRQFFHHEFAKFHTIKIIFVQLLHQINFIRIKLDFFFKILCTTTNVMLLICFARAKIGIFDGWHPVVFLHKSPISSWNLAIFHATYFIEALDHSLHGGSRNGCVFIAKSFVKNLPNLRSLMIIPFPHHEKRCSLSFWKISHRR